MQEVVFGVRMNEGDLYEFDRKPTLRADLPNYQTDITLGVDTIFYNESILIPIPQDEQVSLYDRVPYKANGMEFIDSSIMTFAGIEENFNVPEPKVSIEPIYDAIKSESPSDYLLAFHYDPVSGLPLYDVDLGLAQHTGTSGISSEISSRITNNMFGTGEEYSSADPELVANGYTAEYTHQRVYNTPVRIYMEFSAVQELGTQYKIRLGSQAYSPFDKVYTTIFEEEFTVVATTTDSEDLMDDIIATIAANTSMNKAYGADGDTLVTSAFKPNGSLIFPSGNTAPSAYSLEIVTSYSCAHSATLSSHVDHGMRFQPKALFAYFQKKDALTSVQKSFKSFATHPFAIQYYDHSNRCVGAQPIGSLDLTNVLSSTQVNKGIGARFTIRSNPPTEAVKYQILYAGNKTYKNFIYATVEGAPAVNGSFRDITINFDSYNDTFGTSLAYEFTEGDRIHRLQSYDSGTSTYTVLDDTNPVRIVSVDDTSGIISVLDTTFADGDLVVITTPKADVDDDDMLYYEIGECFDIVEGVHEGNVQTKGDDIFATQQFLKADMSADANGRLTFSVPIASSTDPIYAYVKIGGSISIHNTEFNGAYFIHDISLTVSDFNIITSAYFDTGKHNGIGALDPVYVSWTNAPRTIATGLKYGSTIIELRDIGDIYYRYRAGSFSCYVEDFSMSDLYPSRHWGKGRPSTVTGLGREISGARVRYSQPYYNDTLLNGIATIYAGNFEDYNESAGDIQRVLENNGRLELYHQNKVGFAQINKGIITTASGDTIISKSDSVLSSEEIFYTYEAGIGNQIYSLCSYGNARYFADNITRAVYRLAENGITPISEYKMDSYFNGLFSDGSVQIYSFFDRETYSLGLHIKSGTVNKQLFFMEGRNRWLYFWDIPCEAMIFHNRVVSFEGNKLYSHNGAHNNTIYGSQLTSTLTKTFSEPNTIYKAWQSAMLDPLFSDDDALPITIENEEGQESNLVASDFRRVGTGSWAGFLRDLNTDVSFPLISGEPLMSKTLTLTVRSNSTTDTPINRIVLKYINLEQNNP